MRMIFLRLRSICRLRSANAGPAVERAGSDQVHVDEWTAGHRATDLLRDRLAGRIRRGERQVRGQRTSELVGAGVVRRPVEDGTVAIDAADQHVDLRDDVRGQTVERRLEGRLDVADTD